MKENIICVYSSLLYLIPGIYFIFVLEEYFLSYLLILLSIFASINHSRIYCDKPYYDFIDLMDRLLIVCICSVILFYYYDCFFLWFSGIYLIFCYYLLIPRIKTRLIKVSVHSTIHIITSTTAFTLSYFYGNRMTIEA